MSPGRRARAAASLTVWLAAGWGCDPSASTASDSPVAAEGVTAQGVAAQAPAELEPPPLAPDQGCSTLRALAEDAEQGLEAAALLPVVCPELELEGPLLRRALLRQHDPTRALSWASARGDRELVGIAAMWRRLPLELEPEVVAESLDAAKAIVYPIGARQLIDFDLAQAQLVTGGLSGTTRLHARAYLARIHLEALAALGLDPSRELDPLARRLAGPAIHHALAFLETQMQQPRRSLRARAETVELALLDTYLALELTAPYLLDPLTRDAHHRAWRYLRRSSVRERLDAQLQRLGRSRQGYAADARPRPGPEALASPSLELFRLVDGARVDAAIECAVELARERDGPGAAPVEADLARILDARLAPEAALDAQTRAREAFADLGARAIGERPYEAVEQTPWLAPEAWIEAREAEAAALPDEGFARRLALAALVLELEAAPGLRERWLARPDAPAILRELYRLEL